MPGRLTLQHGGLLPPTLLLSCRLGVADRLATGNRPFLAIARHQHRATLDPADPIARVDDQGRIPAVRITTAHFDITQHAKPLQFELALALRQRHGLA